VFEAGAQLTCEFLTRPFYNHLKSKRKLRREKRTQINKSDLLDLKVFYELREVRLRNLPFFHNLFCIFLGDYFRLILSPHSVCSLLNCYAFSPGQQGQNHDKNKTERSKSHALANIPRFFTKVTECFCGYFDLISTLARALALTRQH